MGVECECAGNVLWKQGVNENDMILWCLISVVQKCGVGRNDMLRDF